MNPWSALFKILASLFIDHARFIWFWTRWVQFVAASMPYSLTNSSIIMLLIRYSELQSSLLLSKALQSTYPSKLCLRPISYTNPTQLESYYLKLSIISWMTQKLSWCQSRESNQWHPSNWGCCLSYSACTKYRSRDPTFSYTRFRVWAWIT